MVAGGPAAGPPHKDGSHDAHEPEGDDKVAGPSGSATGPPTLPGWGGAVPAAAGADDVAGGVALEAAVPGDLADPGVTVCNRK